jgi:hypothetical protein
MTCRYAHLAPEHQLAAVEKLVAFNSPAAIPVAIQAAIQEESTDITTDTDGKSAVSTIQGAVS